MDSSKTQFCVHCGKKIPKGTIFCPFCGTKQPNTTNQTNDNSKKTTFRPIRQQNNTFKQMPKPKHKHGKHKILKRIMWIIAIIIIIVIGYEVYTTHQNNVAVRQDVSSFREQSGTSGWKIGVGKFLDSGDTRAQVVMSSDDCSVSKEKIDDTTPPNDGFDSYYWIKKDGDVDLIGLDGITSRDNNLKVSGASNPLAEKSTPGHTTHARVDAEKRDVDTVADSIGMPNDHDFIIFKAMPNADKSIQPGQFVVLIKK